MDLPSAFPQCRGNPLYRSFTEQLADASRHAGHERFVILIKGVLLLLAIAGLVDAIHGAEPARA